MTKRFNRPFSRQKSAGFTLIEVSIVLIIIGILTVPLMTLYNNYLQQKIMLATSGALAESNNAIQRYYLKNGAYPCPAGLNMGAANAQFGDAICPPSSVAPGTCNAQGICRAAGKTAGETILIGAVPFRSIEMQGRFAADGYKNKLLYTITEKLTVKATFDSNIKEVRIVDANDVEKQLLHGALVAMGKNKLGAYTAEGGLISTCTGPTLDVENCNLDNTIRSSLYSEASGADYFDDSVTTADWTIGKIWERIPGSANDIENKNTGNVGIGTKTPTAKLEVSGGDVRAENIHSQLICDASGNNCFSADLIGGEAGKTALDCGSMAMTGIDKAKAQCGTISLGTLKNLQCPAGQYLRGFTATGTLDCATP